MVQEQERAEEGEEDSMRPETIPAFVLRDYAWGLLKKNDSETWHESKYGGMVPIVPLSEEPELSQFDGPHIVYGYVDSSTGSTPFRRVGALTLAIYDNNYRRLARALSILVTGFDRKDESARDINEYTSTIDAYRGLRFGYVELGYMEGGTPESSEGGRQSGVITITFEYYANYDVETSII